MEHRIKQRVIGAVVLVALAVIFIPMLLTGPVDRGTTKVPERIPPRPQIAGADNLPASTPGNSKTISSDTSTASPQVSPVYGQQPPNKPSATSEAGTQAPEPASAPPRSTPTPATSKLAAWAVQVGSFAQQSNATGLRDHLRKKNFPAYVESVKDGGHTYYRVRLGPVIQREDAVALAGKVHKDLGLDAVVVPH